MSAVGAERSRVPAEPEFWIFVFGDLCVFTVFFFVWSFAERSDPALFEAGRETLHQPIGIANTLLLLTSSAAVALAVGSLRSGRARLARAAYLGAIGLGAGFLALKAIEYGEHLSSGPGSLTGPFYLDYFLFTGVHALHVLLGLVCLLVARAKVRSAARDRPMLVHEAVATYWHMIDVVWVVLFSLIYLT